VPSLTEQQETDTGGALHPGKEDMGGQTLKITWFGGNAEKERKKHGKRTNDPPREILSFFFTRSGPAVGRSWASGGTQKERVTYRTELGGDSCRETGV